LTGILAALVTCHAPSDRHARVILSAPWSVQEVAGRAAAPRGLSATAPKIGIDCCFGLIVPTAFQKRGKFGNFRNARLCCRTSTLTSMSEFVTPTNFKGVSINVGLARLSTVYVT
jgi:hypothetical protein